MDMQNYVAELGEAVEKATPLLLAIPNNTSGQRSGTGK
jgi:hypothetical protein